MIVFKKFARSSDVGYNSDRIINKINCCINMAKSTKQQTIQPMGDRVLVKPEMTGDEKSPSGIIIPDTARKEKPERGEVVAVGGGKRGDDNEIIPVSVKIGDVILFSKYGYEEIKIDEDEYYIVSESNILAVIK
jgi:chaperonin GroES